MNKQHIRTGNVLIHGYWQRLFSGHERPKPARREPVAHGYVLGGGVTLVVTTPGFSLRVWPRLRGAGQPHVVDSWMGHSGKVRRAHYLMVTEQDFANASSQIPEKAQKAARAAHVRGHQQPSDASETREKQRGGQEEEVPEYPRQGSGTPSFTREKPHLPEGGDAHFLLDPRRDGTPPTEVSLSDLAGSLSRLTPEQLEAFVAFAQAMRKGGAR